MKKIYLFFLLAVGFFSFSSCDDFLDNDPPSTLPDDLAFETLEDCEAALNGAYRWLYNYVVMFPAIYEVILDDVTAAGWNDGSYAEVRNFRWSSGTWGASDSPWGVHYSVIARVNNLLKGLEKFEDSDQVKKMKGDAYFLRAMAHFELLRTYGYRYNSATASSDPGIPYVYATSLGKKDRETVAKNVEQILEDLVLAEQHMQPRAANVKVYYLSADALEAFRTRVYLYTGNYNGVITSADKLNHYALTGDPDQFNSIWQNDAVLKEVIFMPGFSLSEVNAGFSLSEVVYIRDKNRNGRSRANFLPSSEIMSLYDKNNDIRWKAYFTEDFPMSTGTTDDNEPLTLVTKFPGNPALSTTDRINQPKLLRYAEVVLNKIEALYHVDETKALAELNSFRTKRMLNYVEKVYSGTELLNQIKLERHREFAFEGMRFYDLRRWNDGFVREEDKYTKKGEGINISATDHHWLFPIPQYEMNANRLPKEYQNPGY